MFSMLGKLIDAVKLLQRPACSCGKCNITLRRMISIAYTFAHEDPEQVCAMYNIRCDNSRKLLASCIGAFNNLPPDVLRDLRRILM